MPEFDTYNTLARYARDNNDPEAILAYRILKRRTQNAVMWRSACNFGVNNLQTASQVQMGAFTEPKDQKRKALDLPNMSEKERRDVFMQAMEETGIQLDPETLAEINKQEVT